MTRAGEGGGEAIISAFIEHVAKASEMIAWQAGVGGMETAGSIISYLAENPEALADFMETGSIMDWPAGWHTHGRLTWHGMNGKLCSPEFARRQMLINSLKPKGAP